MDEHPASAAHLWLLAYRGQRKHPRAGYIEVVCNIDGEHDGDPCANCGAAV